MCTIEKKEYVVTLAGNANDLLSVSEDGTMKIIRLIDSNNPNFSENKNISFDIVSYDSTTTHPEFENLIGKKITVTISVE